MKKNIILDLDNTLLDTRQLQRRMAELFLKIGKIDFFKTYHLASFANETYSYSQHLGLVPNIKARIELDRKVKSFLSVATSMLIFKDVVGFLNEFKNENLFLVTRGESDFQLRKVKNSSLENFFKEVHVVMSPKGYRVVEIILRFNRYGDSYLIDNDPEELEGVKIKVNNAGLTLKTIMITRYEKRSTPNYVNIGVNGLDEAAKFIMASNPTSA